MASRQATIKQANDPQGVVLTNPEYSYGGGGGGGSESMFAGLDNAQALQALQSILAQGAGGSADYKEQRARRKQAADEARMVASGYTKEAAFKDAADLMAQQLRQSLEKNMPSITKAIQGAGTSASSMQGLMSQKLATESAQAAGALGAEQARAYGGIQSQLQGVLEALTRVDTQAEQNLINALNVAKVQRSSSVTNPTQGTVRSGGGSFYQPISGGGGAGAGGSSRIGGRSPVGQVGDDYEGGSISITPRSGYSSPTEMLNDLAGGFAFSPDAFSGGGFDSAPQQIEDTPYIPTIDAFDSYDWGSPAPVASYQPNEAAQSLFGNQDWMAQDWNPTNEGQYAPTEDEAAASAGYWEYY